jgi:2',3'-cyclic-nucleotide 2'-phosphodiesterase
MKILFFGDVIGKLGRKTLAATLPDIKKKYKPDLTIANVENLAHGYGITPKTLRDIQASGVECFTSGNYVFENKAFEDVLQDPDLSARWVRPANYPEGTPGEGARVIPVGEQKVLVINMMGQAFFREEFANPFHAIDAILKQYEGEELAAIFIDFHAEATAEKQAFGWYCDGRVSAVVGTHTQVPSADWRLLHNGTAFVTDVGLVGGRDGVIGYKKENSIERQANDPKARLEVIEEGPAVVNGVLVTIDPKTRWATQIDKIWQEVAE